jgi:hypothetical protein
VRLRYRAHILSLCCGVCLLAADAAAQLPEPRWSISLQAGASVVTEGCGTFGAELGRRLVLGLEVGARLRTVLGDIRKQLDGALQLGWRWRVRRFNVALGGVLGVGGLHGLQGVWSTALLLGPDLELGVRLVRRLELRAGLGTTFYFDRLWIAAWEPRAGLAYSF